MRALLVLRDGEMVEGSPRDPESLRALAEVRHRSPHLRLLVAVGGWTCSTGFSDMALTPALARAQRLESSRILRLR